MVSTPNGAVPIQAVKALITQAGPSTNPYIVPKGQFGAVTRFLISPNHKIQVDGKMVEARFLGLQQEDMAGTFTYFNLELPNCSNMIVGGVTVESLYPIQRVTMKFAEFKALLNSQYGKVTPAIVNQIRNTVRFLENGMVDVPCSGLQQRK